MRYPLRSSTVGVSTPLDVPAATEGSALLAFRIPRSHRLTRQYPSNEVSKMNHPTLIRKNESHSVVAAEKYPEYAPLDDEEMVPLNKVVKSLLSLVSNQPETSCVVPSSKGLSTPSSAARRLRKKAYWMMVTPSPARDPNLLAWVLLGAF